ncbi:MAG: dephospho-CoA kinase [Bacteroidales bacterium]
MLKIGVTGGIGAGKSLVCRVFSALGVPVYNSDKEAQRIMDCDRQLQRLLEDAFGKEVIKGGMPDRRALAGKVFGNPGALERLNGIVHPAVRRDFISWAEKQGDVPYIVKEAAILFETGIYAGLDTVLLVTAPRHQRLKRIMERDGESAAGIRKRMQSQWPDERKIPLAGVVIKNDNSRGMLALILKLHNEFSTGCLPEGMKK